MPVHYEDYDSEGNLLIWGEESPEQQAARERLEQALELLQNSPVATLTYAQIASLVDNRFPTLTAPQRDYLAKLGQAVVALAKLAT